MNKNLTTLILTFNEDLHIKRCIESLLPVSKEIFIIDSFSTDATVEIAESLGAKVFKNPWPGNHAQQFQWALDNCPISTEWVMKMDADEYLLPELSSEISNKLPRLEENITGIFLKRRVVFKQKWIKHGGYYPTKLLRIWRYDYGRMEQRWMDEHIKLSSGKTVEFDADFVDENLNLLTWWTNKHNNYASREAADILNTIYNFKVNDEIIPSWFGTQEQRKRKLKIFYVNLPLFLRPLIYFTYRYFIKLGFLDGKQGLIWHFLQGFWYRFLVDAKIYETYRFAGKDKDRMKLFLLNEYGVNFEKN